MRDVLKKLVELQELDHKAYELNSILEKFPIELESLKGAEKNAADEVEKVKNELKTKEVERKNKEIEIESCKEKNIKYDNQLFQIKDNNEYKTMLKQIDDTKRIVSKLEDEILYILEDIDKIAGVVKEKEQILAQEKDLLAKKEAEVKSKEDEMKGKISDLKQDTVNIAKDIDKKIITTYNNILENKEDWAIVPIEDDCCSACNMILLAHVIDEAKSCNTFIICDTCARILYDKEALG